MTWIKPLTKNESLDKKSRVQAKLGIARGDPSLNQELVQFELKVMIPKDYHAFLPGGESELGVPVQLSLESEGYELMEVQYPKVAVELDFLGKTSFPIKKDLSIVGELKPVKNGVLNKSPKINLQIQLCGNTNGICLPPQLLEFEIKA